MINAEVKIKLSYIKGLRSVVLSELEKNSNIHILSENHNSIFVAYTSDIYEKVKELRSITRAYIVSQDDKYNPSYIANHKSILEGMIDLVFKNHTKEFASFKIICSGSNSPKVRSIVKYVKETYSLAESDDADLKIHVIKLNDIWEMGVQLTPRPLSVRDYRVVNMSGAMDSTIAYAVNYLCSLENVKSYLNIFSGSGTLLIEAGQSYANLDKLVGFDNNKKHLSLSIQNIKKAGLIKKIKIKEADIFDKPDLGKFDVIASDIPFGMSISKGQDLKELYTTFVEYAEQTLNLNGKLAIYTSEYKLIESILSESNFKIIQLLRLEFVTNVNAYLRPTIIICELKNK